jgi:nucleotide-binding universal stress UspA family protein
MTNREPRTEIALNNILFATDFSPASEAAFTYAVAIADRYLSKLKVAHVISIEAFNPIAADSAAHNAQTGSPAGTHKNGSIARTETPARRSVSTGDCRRGWWLKPWSR